MTALLVTNDGEVPFTRPLAGVDPVGDQDFVTKVWGLANLGGGGGFPIAVVNGGTGATSAPDARTNLGLVIGTDVQSYSAKLAAIASLTWANDKGVYLTGTATLATFDLTSFARTFLGSADAAAARTALGLGSLATITPVGTPDGTRYLRDDGVWDTVDATGGGNSYFPSGW